MCKGPGVTGMVAVTSPGRRQKRVMEPKEKGQSVARDKATAPPGSCIPLALTFDKVWHVNSKETPCCDDSVQLDGGAW